MSRVAALAGRAGAMALVVAVAGCGVPSDGEPRRLAADGVPYELLAPATTSTTAAVRVAVDVVAVYLVEGDALVATERKVLAPSVLFRRLTSLLQGLQAEESARGLRTAIPNDTRLQRVTIDPATETATVNLTTELVGVGGQEQILAVAQLVFTVTEVAGVSGVRFEVAGRAIEVPRGDGTLTGQPLRRSDFPSLPVS